MDYSTNILASNSNNITPVNIDISHIPDNNIVPGCDIYKSDMSSLIYEIYNYINNIDYNYIINYINSGDIPMIKLVAILVLISTLTILSC